MQKKKTVFCIILLLTYCSFGSPTGQAEQVEKNRDETDALTGKSVNVAVLDSGVSEHPSLQTLQKKNRYYCSAWFSFAKKCTNNAKKSEDSSGHGTHVAGLIASSELGIAKSATLYSFKIVDKKNVPFSKQVHRALQHIQRHNDESQASEKIHIVNMSFSIEASSEVEAIIRSMHEEQDVLFVASAGNLSSAKKQQMQPFFSRVRWKRSLLLGG